MCRCAVIRSENCKKTSVLILHVIIQPLADIYSSAMVYWLKNGRFLK